MWKCPKCSEDLQDYDDQCWNCSGKSAKPQINSNPYNRMHDANLKTFKYRWSLNGQEIVGSRKCSSEDDLRRHVNAVGGSIIEAIDVSYSKNAASKKWPLNVQTPQYMPTTKSNNIGTQKEWTLKQCIPILYWVIGVVLFASFIINIFNEPKIKIACDFCVDCHNLYESRVETDEQLRAVREHLLSMPDDRTFSDDNQVVRYSQFVGKTHEELVRRKVYPILAEKYKLSIEEVEQICNKYNIPLGLGNATNPKDAYSEQNLIEVGIALTSRKK